MRRRRRTDLPGRGEILSVSFLPGEERNKLRKHVKDPFVDVQEILLLGLNLRLPHLRSRPENCRGDFFRSISGGLLSRFVAFRRVTNRTFPVICVQVSPSPLPIRNPRHPLTDTPTKLSSLVTKDSHRGGFFWMMMPPSERQTSKNGFFRNYAPRGPILVRRRPLLLEVAQDLSFLIHLGIVLKCCCLHVVCDCQVHLRVSEKKALSNGTKRGDGDS